MSDPVDILAIASRHVFSADNLVQSAMACNYTSTSQEWFDRAWAEKSIADADMARVQALIVDLSNAPTP